MDGIKRLLSGKINRFLKNFPVVSILGVRQCGKSTLAKMLGRDWAYFDLENPAHFELISNDPVLFFKENHTKVIIDEAQKYPQLFEVLRGVVDSRRKDNGRFILTGSASYNLVKNISESLAGRVGMVELSTFKMTEFLNNKLSPFFNIFENKITKNDLDMLKRLKPVVDFPDVKKFLLYGGYPQPVLENNNDFYLDWMENYFKTYINRDMRSLFPGIDIIKYQRVIKMLSSLSGTILNKSEIARSVETSEKTIRDYLDIISGTYFWRELPSYRTPKVKTTLKLSKGHFRDSGLLLFLQDVYTKSELDLYPRLGNVFEGFVIEEIMKGVDATKARKVQGHHFRTKAGGEIDLVLEGSFGTLPVEIKYSSNTTKKQLTSMINFIDLHSLPYGIVVNNCEKPSMITEKIIQIPAGCL